MKINIIKRKLELEKEQHEEAISRCERLCKRFVDSINSVTMRLSDINGPKGGIDKECIVQIQLINGGVITAAKRHEHVPGAIHRSLDTARALLRRKLGQKKRRSKHNTPHSI